MTSTVKIPDALKSLVTQVGEPVTTSQIDAYGKWQDIRDQSYRLRTVLSAWKSQQSQDRTMRQQYAWWLMFAMGAQIVVINVVFVLIGCKVLVFEPWTANCFIMSVFAEVAAQVLLVVKYLFARPDDTLLKLAQGKGDETDEH